MTRTPEIPDKLYFKIGEVARIVGVEPYVLRYWESELSVIRPGKTRSRHRLYRRRDVETLLEVRRLLHEERYTIEGARRRLKEMRGRVVPNGGEQELRRALREVRHELQGLRRMLQEEK